ncbi:hypothetical protein ACFQU5_00655 [Ureibacillus sp. GCM10028918]
MTKTLERGLIETPGMILNGQLPTIALLTHPPKPDNLDILNALLLN